jgi:hypothetical protein
MRFATHPASFTLLAGGESGLKVTLTPTKGNVLAIGTPLGRVLY